MILLPEKILDFWFKETPSTKWFDKDPSFDKKIRDLFLETYDAAKAGNIYSWKEGVDSYLALVILFDQFPRNMFRGDGKAFETDSLALKIAKKAIKKGLDKELGAIERKFLYMPFMHSENLEDQRESVKLFSLMEDQETTKYAIQHANIIEKFSRFPHRNKILKRQSSKEEELFLKTPGSSF